MADHLPILQIVVPLISAPICLLLRRRMLAWAFATARTRFAAQAMLTAVGLAATISPLGATMHVPPMRLKPSSLPALAAAATQVPFW